MRVIVLLKIAVIDVNNNRQLMLLGSNRSSRVYRVGTRGRMQRSSYKTVMVCHRACHYVFDN